MLNLKQLLEPPIITGSSFIASLNGGPLEKLIVLHLVRKFPYFVEKAKNKSDFKNIFNKGHCFFDVLLNMPWTKTTVDGRINTRQSRYDTKGFDKFKCEQRLTFVNIFKIVSCDKRTQCTDQQYTAGIFSRTVEQ